MSGKLILASVKKLFNGKFCLLLQVPIAATADQCSVWYNIIWHKLEIF